MTDQIKVKVTGEDEGVSTLLRTLSKQLGEVQKSQKKANDETAAASKAQQSLAKSVTGTIANLKKLAVSYAALRALRFIDDQINAADALSKLSQKSGATTEALSVLAFAGETADVSIDQLTTSMAHLSKSLTALQQNDRATVDAFKAIGISANDLKGLSVDDAFKKIANAMGGFEDSSDKATVAMQIFGKSGAELIPLLNDMANGGFEAAAKEAQRFGKFLSTDAGKAAGRFNDDLRILQSQAEGTALAFGSKVIPALSDVITTLGEMRGTGEKAVAETIGDKVAGFIRSNAAFWLASIKTIGEAYTALKTVGVATFEGLKKAATFDFSGARKEGEKAQHAFDGLGGSWVRNFDAAKTQLDNAEKKRDAESVAAREEREDKEKKRVQLQNSQTAAELAKARADAEQHAREGEGKILADSLASAIRKSSASFGRGWPTSTPTSPRGSETIVEPGKAEVAASRRAATRCRKQPVTTKSSA
jgi:hypothetical protein